MPELPEVELHRLNLQSWLEKPNQWELHFLEKRILQSGTVPQIAKAISSHFPPTQIFRKGKYLQFSIGNHFLITHLGMSGKWIRSPISPSHPRMILKPTSGESIYLQDPRLFSKMYWIPKANFSTFQPWQSLGVDPLHQKITGTQLQTLFKNQKGLLKTKFLEQKWIAGIGNIHAGEILFRAKLSPWTRIESVTLTQWEKIVQALYETFELVLNGPKELTYFGERGKKDSEFLVYKREGLPCLSCKQSPIVRLVQQSRSTYYCPECQK